MTYKFYCPICSKQKETDGDANKYLLHLFEDNKDICFECCSPVLQKLGIERKDVESFDRLDALTIILFKLIKPQ